MLDFITKAFIDVFGITQPTPQQHRTASRFITAMLGLILLVAVLGVALLYHLGHR